MQPDSLHPYIMDRRIKEATGTGGIITIPIASANTLGGIKVPADSGITVTGSGNAYAAKSYDYGSEVNTGRKLGTDDVYVRLITLDTPVVLRAGTGAKVLDDISNIKYIIDIKVFSTTSISCADLMTYEQESNLYMVSPYDIEVKSFIIEYTKED